MRMYWRWLLLFSVFTTHTAMAWCFNLAAQEFNLEPRIIYAIAKAESGLQPDALHINQNGSVDIGLMQINSVHQQELMNVGIALNELVEPCKNTIVGAWLLRKSIDKARGDFWRGVGLYHSATPEYNRKYILRVKEVYSEITPQELSEVGLVKPHLFN